MSDKKVKITGYKRSSEECKKCGCRIVVESDFLSESQIKTLHHCRKGKSEK